MIYKCSIKNIEKAKEIETNEKNLDFFIGEIEFLASGNIDDRLYISEEVLKEYAHTVPNPRNPGKAGHHRIHL